MGVENLTQSSIYIMTCEKSNGEKEKKNNKEELRRIAKKNSKKRIAKQNSKEE